MPRESAERRFLKDRIAVNVTTRDVLLAEKVQHEENAIECQKLAQALQETIEADQHILDASDAVRKGERAPETIGDQIGASAQEE